METTQETANIESSFVDKKTSSILIYSGYGILLISFLLFILFEYFTSKKMDDVAFMAFMGHYALATTYMLILAFNKSFGIKRSWKKENIHKTIILLNLFLVSAYALNRSIPIFENSTDWFWIYLIISSITLLSFRYFDKVPIWVNWIQYTLLGSSLVLYFYLSTYVSYFYLFGFIGALMFGIGLHIFVPITLLIGSIKLIMISYQTKKVSYLWIAVGFFLTVGATTLFIIEWNHRVSKIESANNQSVIFNDTELPIWLKVGETMENDWISQRILKSNLVYTMPSDVFGEWEFMPRNVNWEEQRKHDPLVFLASMGSKCNLPGEERVKILQAISDTRHMAHERLWAGDNLTTSYIISDIDVYPDLRLAFTEKYLNVRNNDNRGRWWGNRQEAIYTFQLPEGSVVTSLSLWIEGKEEKGILTSKQKASTAYKTVVGVERRDPSVVHWQEGNTVTVRVFPCTDKEERKFKIGITSPLTEKEGRIFCKNITFRGPNASKAKETTRIRMIGTAKNIEIPKMFTKNAKGDWVLEDQYNPDFEMSFDELPIKANRFSFDGFTYSLEPYHPDLQAFTPDKIYLDINNSWTNQDLQSLKKMTDKYTFYVHTENAFISMNDGNWDDLTDDLKTRNFSLFPFHLITDTEHSLIITKGKELSPHLSDFKESEFAKKVSRFFGAGKKPKVYNLSSSTSTYISSLREFRGLEYGEGNTDKLKKWLEKQLFPVTNETGNYVILHCAEMSITKKTNDTTALDNNAPDHLARLFAYNDIMRKVGKDYFNDDFINDDLVDEATTAYVVSPVSSLIVLESQEDYKRFGIKDKTNSLHNASKDSSGAVPEPHEWALIILFIGFVFFTIRHSKLKIAI
jgi:XrtN system VIT domain protein